MICVSNFEQMTTAKECMQISDVGARRCPMPTTDQFWQYAKEAILSASYAKTDEDRRDMLDLARTWTQAALLERQAVNHDRPAETGTA